MKIDSIDKEWTFIFYTEVISNLGLCMKNEGEVRGVVPFGRQIQKILLL